MVTVAATVLEERRVSVIVAFLCGYARNTLLVRHGGRRPLLVALIVYAISRLLSITTGHESGRLLYTLCGRSAPCALLSAQLRPMACCARTWMDEMEGLMQSTRTGVDQHTLLFSAPNPAADYDAALVRFALLRAQDGAEVNPVCRSTLLTHGEKTERVIVLVHGTVSGQKAPPFRAGDEWPAPFRFRTCVREEVFVGPFNGASL